MVNPMRGEVSLVIDGEARVLRLSLGALVALEDRLGAGSLLELAERFEAGRFSGGDLVALLSAGLSGGGAPMAEEALLAAEIEGGPLAAARAAAALLARAFRVPE